MRIGLVSPYSWTYPGGVNRHLESLARELLARGHDVRVFAPWDDDTRRAALLHRGARPQRRERPAWLVALGGTVGWSLNGSVSNLALHPHGVTTLRRELRAFAPDVVHVHEPNAPTPGWDTLMTCDAPMVGTFHTYSTQVLPFAFATAGGVRRRLNRLAVRIAVSEAAAWTGRRFQGGEYRIVPNGVDLPPGGPPAPRERAPGDELRLVFVGRAVARKGLPVLLRAFEALRAVVPATLTVVGVSHAELAPLVDDPAGVRALGPVDEARKLAELTRADLLVAPSLGGESFGMVLTEAFAAGTPVVASDIAGYRDVVGHGREGVLVAPGDPGALAAVLLDAAVRPEGVARAARAAAASARRFAWPHVADQVEQAYADAIAAPAPTGVAARIGLRPADGGPRIPARRLAPLDPAPAGARRRALARRAGMAGGIAAVAGTALYGLHRVGPESVGRALVDSSPPWALAALAVMCLSMLLRAVAWQAILRGALPGVRVRLRDAWQGTAIGVLMSATLPARLGEPARALLVARRLGRPRERLPVVLGTLVSQTLINVVALAILGVALVDAVGLFAGRGHALLLFVLGPLALVAAVVVAPTLLWPAARSSRLRALRRAARRVRSGLAVFGHPRLGPAAVTAQLGAWTLQWLSCYLLLVALGLEHRAGLGAAAAVLFAVNVSAVLPVTPSNVGVFQAACAAVLTGAYGVRAGDALGYGIVLQAVELATAFLMGAPALVREGLSWRDVRVRTLHAAPVQLAARRSSAFDDAR